MDVLIKNMEMPKERKMFVIEPDGSVWVQIADTSYFCTGSKAVPLPPHGPLADLNKIKDKFRTASKMCEATNKLERAKHWRDAEGLVNESEVILESTEEVEETT